MNLEDIIPAKLSKTVKVDFGDEIKEVTIYEMDIDYVLRVEAKQLQDTHVNGVMHNSNMTEEEVRSMGIKSVMALYDQIVTLTYGESTTGENAEEQIKKK